MASVAMPFIDALKKDRIAQTREILCSRQFRIIAITAFAILLGFEFIVFATSHSDDSTSSSFRLPWRTSDSHKLPDRIESPLLVPSNLTVELQKTNSSTVPSGLKKSTPKFHLLLHAPRKNEDVCRSILSSMVLHYPPATVLNWESNFDTDRDQDLAKLRGVRNYLMNDTKVDDGDLIVVADAANILFQLPAELMLREYETLVQERQTRLLAKYGTEGGRDKGDEAQPRYHGTVVFGVGDCPIGYDPTDICDDDRALSSSVVIGPSKEVLRLYTAALRRITIDRGTAPSLDAALAAFRHEQESARTAVLEELSSPASRIHTWWHGDDRLRNFTLAKQTDEYSIALDTSSKLVAALPTHAEDELPTDLSADPSTKSHFSFAHTSADLPQSLLHLPGPFSLSGIQKPDETAIPDRLQPVHHLDTLPLPNTSWADQPLLANVATHDVPPILLFNPDTDPNLKDAIWTQLYYQPHARALLRARLRSSVGPLGFSTAALGGDYAWDRRGGIGGVWQRRAITSDESSSNSNNAKEEWKSWGEVCSGKVTVTKTRDMWPGDRKSEEFWLPKGAKMMLVDELVFGDGKGEWGKEEGLNAPSARNRWGRVVREGTGMRKL